MSYAYQNNNLLGPFCPLYNFQDALQFLLFVLVPRFSRFVHHRPPQFLRSQRIQPDPFDFVGRFTFDTQKQILAIGDKQTKLTTKESELLGLLCAHANEILQRDFALKTIWIDDNYFNARSMDVYITKLRKHLKEDDSIEIINIHGKGYKLITPDND